MALIDWAKLSDIAQVVEGIAVMASLWFIWIQLRQQTKLAKVDNSHKIVELATDVRMHIIQDREMSELYFRGMNEYEGFSETDKFRYRRLVALILHLYENVYIQRQNGLISEDVYLQWDVKLQDYLVRQDVASVWKDMTDSFNEQFDHYLANLLQSERPKNITYQKMMTASDTTKNDISVVAIEPESITKSV